MTRRIILTLASDTTETECGACPRFNASFLPCTAAGRDSRGKLFRLPECIAAESKPLSQMVSENAD